MIISARVAFGMTVIASILVLGCTDAGRSQVVGIDAVGAITGIVFLDANANNIVDAGDTPLSAVGIAIVTDGNGDTLTTRLSRADGTFDVGVAPVGSYRALVDTLTIPMGETVRGTLPDVMTVSRDQTVSIVISIGQP